MPSLISALKAKLSSPPLPAEDAPSFRPACLASNGEPNAPISSSFSHELGAHGWGNAELQNYTASDDCSFMRDGHLVICGRVDSAAGRFESARLRSRFSLADGPGGKERGFLWAKITAPVATGIWPAFWLLPTEPFTWPGDGEIDILETWNGKRENSTCLHWGHYNGADYDRHRVWGLEIADMDRPEGHEYGLAWDQGQKRLVWYINGKPEMKAKIPGGMRKMGEFQVMLNVAMGGNVQQGRKPEDGAYELVIHDMEIRAAPPGGWTAFEQDWKKAREGHTM